MQIKYHFRCCTNRLKAIWGILRCKPNIMLWVDREDTPIDVIVLYPDEIAFYGEGPYEIPMKLSQLWAINAFKKAWKDSFTEDETKKEIEDAAD